MAAWQLAPFPTEAQVIAWARVGNVGLRTGAISGIVVVDVDEGADVAALNLPPTVTVITGSGRPHFYFQHPGGRIPNSVGRLAPHVDIRGDGGQVVFVGSIHPVTGKMYLWADGLSPDQIDVAPLPDHVLAALRPRHSANSANIAKPFPPPLMGFHGRSRYGRVALDRQAQAVQLAPDGIRNVTLNKAAFGMGRLVDAGHLSAEEASLRLEWAASSVGLSAREVMKTIRSGMTAGMRRGR